MSPRHRDKPPRRPRALSPRLIIACEGEKTEYDYLTTLNQSNKGKTKAVLKVVRVIGSDPVRVVRSAMDQRSKDLQNQKFSKCDGDKLYALIDVEPHDPSKAGKLAEALGLAEKEEVHVLLSNPSFEFWLLCHLVNNNEACRSFVNPQECNQEIRNLINIGKDDLHRHPKLYQRFHPKARHAIEVARHVHQIYHKNTEDMRNANACTEVYVLIDNLLRS